MHRTVAFLLMIAAFPALAADGQSLSVTIYNSDLALVQDVRQMPITAGRQRLEFRDVSAQIRPETAKLSARGLSVVEQNFDYDLLTPDKLMEKAVGKDIQIVRTTPGTGQQVTETARVLSANEGVVLQIGNRVEVLRDDGIPTRVIFDKVPENLRARPTLSVTINSTVAGQQPATLTYLTTGLSWRADYVAHFDEVTSKMDFQGWITLGNTSGVAYPDAKVQLVAGNINLRNATPNYRGYGEPRSSLVRAGSEGGLGGNALADYYIYSLGPSTTIAQNQNKQVSFLEARGVPARKVYRYEASGFQTLEQPSSAEVALQFENSRRAGLAMQLPAGVVRVFIRDQDGSPKFIGEDSVEHIPQGSELSVKTGDAFDVSVQPTVVKNERRSTSAVRYSMAYVVRNARAEPVTVHIRQRGLLRNGKVISESSESRRIDASTLEWAVVAPANGYATLSFVADTGW